MAKWLLETKLNGYQLILLGYTLTQLHSLFYTLPKNLQILHYLQIFGHLTKQMQFQN